MLSVAQSDQSLCCLYIEAMNSSLPNEYTKKTGMIARLIYSKTCLKRPRKKDKTQILMTNGSLMQVESIAECSPWSILQYFWPALSDSWSLNPIFGLFESGRFYQVLHYLQWMKVILCLLRDWLIYESLVMHIHHNLSVSWHPSVFWRKV